MLSELLARGEAARWNESWKYDAAAYAERAATWREIARITSQLRSAPGPDPRIADAIERILATTPGDHWFRVEEVSHVLGRLAPDPTAPDEPSFADHALALLAVHGRRPDRLVELADRLLIEASCNEAEMSDRLRALASTISTS